MTDPKPDRQAVNLKDEAFSRLKLASLLDDVLADYRYYQASQNWLVGHSLAEAIQERIDQIGTSDGKRHLATGTPTRIGHVLSMKENIVQLVKDIKALKDLEEKIPPSGNPVAHPDA